MAQGKKSKVKGPKDKGYGQFCPVAKTAEIIAERWTPLVLRELLCGSHRFNDLRRGVPLMSPSLLSRRLRELERAGIVEKRPAREGRGSEYWLTPAGEDLRSVVELMGAWGQRWIQEWGDLEELDPGLLMWDIQRRVDRSRFPADRKSLLEFTLGGVATAMSKWWLVVDGGVEGGEDGEVDLCQKHPGYEVDVYISADIDVLVQVWLGRYDLRRAIRSQALELSGRRELISSFPDWFLLSETAVAAPTVAAS